MAGAGLLDLGATVVRRHQSFGHDLADAEAGLVRVWEARDVTVREDLEPLRLCRVDRQRPYPTLVGRHAGVLCVSPNRISRQPGEHQNVLIRQRLSIPAINLKTAVEPLLVLHPLESTNTCSRWGFHQFGALRSSR